MTHPLNAELRGRAKDCECIHCQEALVRAADVLSQMAIEIEQLQAIVQWHEENLKASLNERDELEQE